MLDGEGHYVSKTRADIAVVKRMKQVLFGEPISSGLL